jgi:excisionase family DNA binding protein
MPQRPRPRSTRYHVRPRPMRPPTIEADLEFLTIEATAVNLDVSTRSVRRWIESGELAAYRIGRLVRIAPSDLTAFLGRHRVD